MEQTPDAAPRPQAEPVTFRFRPWPVEVGDLTDEIPQEYRLVVAVLQRVQQAKVSDFHECLPLCLRTYDGSFGSVRRGTDLLWADDDGQSHGLTTRTAFEF